MKLQARGSEVPRGSNLPAYPKMATAIEDQAVSCIEAVPGERISVYRCHQEGKDFELRFESYSEGIGWFTQNSIRLSQTELSALRGLLSCQKQGSCRQRVQLELGNEESEPKILRFPEQIPARSNTKLAQ